MPAGADVPMVVLSGCSTGLAARQERLHPGAAPAAPPGSGGQRLKQDDEDGEGEGEAVLASFAAQLVRAGVPMVLAMQAPVTDPYATALSAGFYRRLATDASPDPLLALAAGTAGGRTGPAGAAARLAAARPGGVGDPGADHPGAAAAAVQPARAARVRCTCRRRRCWPRAWWSGRWGTSSGGGAEMRQARRVLGGTRAGLVLHGIGGVGKSSLAAEVLRSLGEDTGLVASRAGQVSVDDVLGEIGARLHQVASAAEGGEGLARAALYLRAADVEWADRWRLLAEQILPAVPMTVLLDNFEDNLKEADGGWQVRDPELAAFLAGWARRPGQSKLVFTCRYPFHAARAGRAAADRPAPGPAVGGRDQQADVAAARPGRPLRRR